MAEIKNMEGLSVEEVNRQLAHGARFVYFSYTISIIILTFKRSSGIYFIRAGESSVKFSIGYTLLTFFLGWWGFPWGPIYTIGSLITNFSGGKDVTQDVINMANA